MHPSKIVISNFLPIIMATQHLMAEYDHVKPEETSVLLVNAMIDQASLDELLTNDRFKHIDSFTFETFSTLTYNQRYDLAVIFLDEPFFRQDDTTHLIVSCRDLFARHCLVFAPMGQNLTAFGFTKFALDALNVGDNSYFAWQFNLFDYKQLPDWFNSRFWANPENWNKFRW